MEYKKTKLLYKKGDYEKISEHLDKVDWEEEFSEKNVQDNYSRFLNVYNEACERFIPKVGITGSNQLKPKWLNRGIKSKIRKKLALWWANQRAKWSIPNLASKYKDLKKNCAREVKEAVKDYEKNIASNAKKNPKMVYSYVNSKKVVKENIRALIDENGMRTESPSEITRILNKQFDSVFEADNGERPVFERENREYDWGK